MADKNESKEYSSFCSACNSMLQSVCSIGTSSLLEVHDENNVYTDDNIIGTTNNVTKLVSSKSNEENVCIANSVTAVKPRGHNEQDVIKNGNTIIKKRKHLESENDINARTSRIISAKRIKSGNNVSDNTKLEKDRAPLLLTTKGNKLNESVSGVNDNLSNFVNANVSVIKPLNKTDNITTDSILHHRKAIVKRLNSTIYLW